MGHDTRMGLGAPETGLGHANDPQGATEAGQGRRLGLLECP